MESMQRIKSLELLVENDPTSDLPVNSTVYTCTSRMYVNKFQDGHVELTYVKGHTGHELGVCELPHLSIPASIRETIAMKISLGIPAERIMEGKVYHDDQP